MSLKPRLEPATLTPAAVSDPEAIQAAIIELAAGMKRLGLSRLKQETIVTLLHADTGIAKRDIRLVLHALGNLEATFLKPIK